MEKPQVIIPIALPALRNRNVKGPGLDTTKAIELSFVSGKPSTLATWGFTPQLEDISPPSWDHQTVPLRGASIGCEDGSVYILHPKVGAKTDLISPAQFTFELADTLLHTQPSTPSVVSHLGRNPSAFSSQSSLKSATNPFHLSKSRIVSGVTAEAVEAPKNYVDFEEEQEKLKDLLKRKNSTKERHQADGVLPSFEKSIPIDKHPLQPLTSITTELQPRKTVRKKPENRIHPPTHSRTPSHPINSTSTPTSPTFSPPHPHGPGNIYSLYLRSHTFPSRFGPGRAVSQLLVDESQRYIVCLQENGDISVLSTTDGACHVSARADSPVLVPPPETVDHRTLHCVWTWKCLHLVNTLNSTFIISLATADSMAFRRDSSESDLQDHTRVSVHILTPDSSDNPKLEKVGEWRVDGCAGGVSCHKYGDDSFTLVYVDCLQRIMSHTVRLAATAVSRPPLSRRPSRSGVIGLPNPFKALRTTHMGAPDTVEIAEVVGRVEVDAQVELGVVTIEGSIIANRTIPTNDGKRTILWTESGLTVVEAKPSGLREIWSNAMPPVDAWWIDASSFVVAYPGNCELYTLTAVDADGLPASGDTPATNITCDLTRSTSVPGTETTTFTSAGDLVSTNAPHPSLRSVNLTILPKSGEIESSRHHALCEISAPIAAAEVHASASLVLDIDSLVIGYSDGFLHSTSLSRLCSSSPEGIISDVPLRGPITALFPVENERTKEQLIVGGADDGSIAFWSAETLKTCARWTLFNTPLAHAICIKGDAVGRLKGSLLCIAQDGTIAVLCVDGFQFMYLIPTSMSPLIRMCIGGDNLLLIYGDRHARLWDVKTQEFWRAMTVDKADELVGQGGWAEWSLDTPPDKSLLLSGLDTSLSTLDSATVFHLNLAAFLVRTRPAMGQSAAQLPESEKRKVRSVLSILLAWGLNEGIDEICRGRLNITPAVDVGVGYSRSSSTSLYTGYEPASGWRVSPEQSASRALAILACLQVLSRDASLNQDVEVVSTFYAASLRDLVGEAYHGPSLSFLAIAWVRYPDEFREPAKLLFNAGLARFTDQEIAGLAESWQHKLPCLQPDVEKSSLTSVVATFICGSIAVEKYSLLSPSCLTDVSKSISMYLHDDRPICKILAIDLCSRGFDTWQSYIDVMELLRSLFTLATYTKKDGITTLNVGAVARSAVLQIASSNTPLVMTTLSMDILHVTDIQKRKSLMQMLAFLIRKRPLAIQPNLPRLIEAVVKSLDPNASSNREATIDAATEILVHVVQTFPTVDFHMNTQRLAVGTSEGAIIMFDLKTATRLYVLEGHRQRLAACSFSPDGRRLITVSLDENAVLVWKVGSSFSSFFNPGAPPRQGHGDGEPFKTWEFNVGDAAKLTPAETLVELKTEWVGDRSVKLMIRDVTMTFST